MTTTNRYDLPQVFVDAVQDHHPRHECLLHVTELIAPVRQVWLKRLHLAEIVEDAVDQVMRFIGSAVHEKLARDCRGWIMMEERLEWKLLDIEDAEHPFTLTGAVDHYDPKTRVLTDFKTTSTYSIKDGVKPEWTNQLNVYAWLLQMNGWTVDALQSVVILRDWKQSQASREGYPKAAVVKLPVPLWGYSERHGYVMERAELHYRTGYRRSDPSHPGYSLYPSCTREERWEALPVYAVMKEGRKTAVKLFKGVNAKQEATVHILEHAERKVVERPTTPKRCESYCDAAPWCNWWQANKPKRE